MRLGNAHLSYCTNIHPGETWDEIRDNLERYLPRVKRAVSPSAPFGVGLRLSASAARALGEPTAREAFLQFLRTNDLYVFTINGFPYGPFHGTRVKEDVYLPDWRDEARLAYTNALADLLPALMPPGEHECGSISTVPGAFKPNAATPEAVARIADLLIRHVAHLVDVERATGRRIALALEPEPCCLLETIDETLAFFGQHLHSRPAAVRLAALTRSSVQDAERMLRRHLGVCLDLCHAAVEFEDGREGVRLLRAAGIAVAKVQVTAGLRIPQVTDAAVRALQAMQDNVYLHQVVERGAGALHRYADIEEACASQTWRGGGCEWRVHFHVPVFMDALDAFSSTQSFVRDVLALQREQAISSHLEVETYTWSVLPAAARAVPIEDAIARELAWVSDVLA